jgi:hypothetical protein
LVVAPHNSAAQQKKKISEMLDKLQKAQAAMQLQLHKAEAKDARTTADKDNAAGYVYAAESDLKDDILKGIRRCLSDQSQFLGGYVVGVIRSTSSPPSRDPLGGGSDPSDINFDLDKYIGGFMRENAPIPADGPGAWILVDVGKPAVEYRWNDAWPDGARGTSEIDQFIADHSFEKAHRFSDSDEPLDDNICGLLGQFEAQLHRHSKAVSGFYLSERIQQVDREVDKLTARLRNEVLLPYEKQGDDTLRTVDQATQLMERIDALQQSLPSSTDPLSGDAADETASVIDELDAKLRAGKQLWLRVTDSRDALEGMRYSMKQTTNRTADRAITYAPYSDGYRQKLQEARDAIDKYARAIPRTADEEMLDASRATARNRVSTFTNYASDTEFQFNLIVYYAPISLIALLFGFGGLRLYGNYSEARRTRSNLEWLVNDRRSHVTDANRQLDELVDRYQAANNQTADPLPASNVPADLPVDSGKQAVDLALSLASLETHLLDEASTKLQQAGALDADSLSAAETRLTTDSTLITPGTEWDRAKLDATLSSDIEVNHRELPDQLDACIKLAAAVAPEPASADADARQPGSAHQTSDESSESEPTGKDGDDIHW